MSYRYEQAKSEAEKVIAQKNARRARKVYAKLSKWVDKSLGELSFDHGEEHFGKSECLEDVLLKIVLHHCAMKFAGDVNSDLGKAFVAHIEDARARMVEFVAADIEVAKKFEKAQRQSAEG